MNDDTLTRQYMEYLDWHYYADFQGFDVNRPLQVLERARSEVQGFLSSFTA